jgi:hypothetical protein
MNYFNYFSEIEELFIRRRGRNLLLSPLDWALIESWQEREVPLHIICAVSKKFSTALICNRCPQANREKSALLQRGNRSAIRRMAGASSREKGERSESLKS